MSRQIKIILASAVGLVALGGVLFYAQPKATDHSTMNKPATGEGLKIAIDPTDYDFGTISMKNGKVTKLFAVKNDQAESVFLSELYTSCMCTEAKFKLENQEFGPFGMLGHGAMKMLNQALGAGQSAQVEVTFDPNAHGPSGIGVIERTVTLQSDKGEVATVNIKANVTP